MPATFSLDGQQANRDARVRAVNTTSPYRQKADAALSRFLQKQSVMRDQVKDGMTTHRAAKEAGGLFVQELRQALADASSFTTRPELKAKLLTAKNARVDAKARVTTDDLLREMVKGQERLRTEQEIANRQASFRSVDRRMGPSGVVMIEDLPTALYQHRAAKEANDQAALTFWSRRLEGLRHMALDAAQHDAIDTAVTTRDMVNPRIVARFVDALGRATPEEVDRFAREALAEGHSSGIAATFVLARSYSEPDVPLWARKLIHSDLTVIPDAAFAFAEDYIDQVDKAEATAAMAVAEGTVATAEQEIGSIDLVKPITEHDRQMSASYAASPMGRAHAESVRSFQNAG